MKTLAKGERVPKYTYKSLSYITDRHNVYDLFNGDKIVGTLYEPRHKGMPRKFEAA